MACFPQANAVTATEVDARSKTPAFKSTVVWFEVLKAGQVLPLEVDRDLAPAGWVRGHAMAPGDRRYRFGSPLKHDRFGLQRDAETRLHGCLDALGE